MESWPNHGSLVLATKRFSRSPRSLPGQLARPTIMPSRCSLPATFTSSGTVQCPPPPTRGMVLGVMPRSANLSSRSLSSPTLVDWHTMKSGRPERIFCTRVVASASGGVYVSSATIVSARSFATCSRIGFMKLTTAAELSPTKATLVGRAPVDLLARSTIRGNSAVACASAVGEDWKMYLKPRPVIRSEYDSVSQGSSARSVTSVTASVKLDSQQPMPPTTSGSCATRRCAAFLAFSAVSPVSYRTSFILAPPRALMPPLLLTSSMASSAPICSRMPWRAHGPERGTTRAIFTSRGFCARARRGTSTAAVPASPILMAVRRPIDEGMVMRVISIWLWVLRVGQPEVRAADPIVGEQGLVRPIEHDMTRLQHVAMVRALERFGHALLHEEDGQPVLAVNLGDALEDQIGHAGGEAHRRLVQHQEPWRA